MRSCVDQFVEAEEEEEQLVKLRDLGGAKEASRHQPVPSGSHGR